MAINLLQFGFGVLLSTTLFFGGLLGIQNNSQIELSGTYCFPSNGCTGTSTTPTLGQILFGDSVGRYSLNTLTAGNAITITNATNSITIAANVGAINVNDWVKDNGTYATTSLTASTTIPYWAKSDIYASSTLRVSGLTNLLGGLNASSTATSTFANGIQLDAGCFRLANGECAVGSSNIVSAFAWTPRTDGNATTTRILLDNGFISSASSTISSSLQIAGNLQASSTISANNLFVVGNTGIGTTSPAKTLSVQGNAFFSGDISNVANITSTGTLTMNNSSGGIQVYIIGNASNGNTLFQLLEAAAPAGGAAQFILRNPVTNANRIFFDASGVGNSFMNGGTLSIGTTTSGDSANGATVDLFYLTSSNNATNTATRMSFRTFNEDNNIIQIAALTGLLNPNYNSGNGNLLFSTMNAGTLNEVARLTNVGRLGIGTTSPSQLLSIQGNVFVSGNLVNVANVTATGTLTFANASTTGMITIGNGFISSASSTVAAPLQVAGNIQASSSLTVAGSIFGYGTASSSIATALGIGSTTPSRALGVVGGLLVNDAGGFLRFQNANQNNLYVSGTNASLILDTDGSFPSVFLQKNGSSMGQFSLSSNDIELKALNSAGQILFYTGGNTERARLNSSGLLGIGTTSPWGTLSVEMGTVNPSFVVSNNGSSTPSLYIGGVNQNGFVGIGTTSLSQISGTKPVFSVAGPVYIAGTTTLEELTLVTKGDIGSSTPRINTLYKENIVKGWVHYTNSGNAAIRDAFNVSSVTDSAVGRYVVNWANAFPNTNYATLCTTSGDGIAATLCYIETLPTTSSITIISTNVVGTPVDRLNQMIIAIGDQ